MLQRFHLAGALALLVALSGCAELGYANRQGYPSSRRAPTYGGGYDRGYDGRAYDQRIDRDAAQYAQFLDRNLHLSQRQEYAIRDILVDRTYRELDRGRAYPFPRQGNRARSFWNDADRRIERVLDPYQRDYYRHLTRRGERYYRDTYYHDYGYQHYDRFPQRWRTRHSRDYYRSRSRSYRTDRRYDRRDDRRDNRRTRDTDGNRRRTTGRADHGRNGGRVDRDDRDRGGVLNLPGRVDRARQNRARRAEQQRAERERSQRRAEQQRERQRAERQRNERRAEQQRAEQQRERQRAERQRNERRAERERSQRRAEQQRERQRTERQRNERQRTERQRNERQRTERQRNERQRTERRRAERNTDRRRAERNTDRRAERDDDRSERRTERRRGRTRRDG